MLILPGSPAFAHCLDNLTGTPTVPNVGASFTANANNVDGTAVAVLGALPFDLQYLVIGITGIGTSGTQSHALLDVLIDPAGGTSWGTWIDDLICGYTNVQVSSTSAAYACELWYHFPIWLKAGHALGIRCRTAHTANLTTGRCVMYAYGGSKRPDLWWCGTRVESVGTDAATSKGTAITPGNTGTYSSWVSIGSPTTGRYGAIQMGVNGSDDTATNIGYFWQIGAGSSKLAGSPTLYHSMTAGEIKATVGFCQPIWCDVPAGTQMQLRATASGTAEAYNAALYGVL